MEDRTVAGKPAVLVVTRDEWRKPLEDWATEKYGEPVQFSHYETTSRSIVFVIQQEGDR